ncbi:MAG: hypothetical protein KKG00_06070, partial [Bacteroidetes bacterium]|nr:hypothetical protein [Bacteroidota bacterium]
MRNPVLLALCLFYVTIPLVAQTLSRQEMEEDLRYLDKKIVNWYPGLGYYTPKEQYAVYQDSLRHALPDSLGYLPFYRQVTSLIS